MCTVPTQLIEQFEARYILKRTAVITQEANDIQDYQLEGHNRLDDMEAYWFSNSDKISTQDLEFRYQIFTKSGHLVADNLKTTKEVKDFILSPKIIWPNPLTLYLTYDTIVL